MRSQYSNLHEVRKSMNKPEKDILDILLKRGVSIPAPASVEVGQEVDPEKISGKGVIIHTGCKIYGHETVIMPGTEIGFEAPATIDNCQIGRGVKLKGGYFSNSCFLDEVTIGSGAHIREACLLEEKSKSGHTVGLKQTILFPFVTLGSLINFCDCLMAGGTDEKNHSEVGSSYIHFNYTPNQDKATPSLIGDVPEGVMMDQHPIFLGGQGGMVGPLRINYGTVVAAGTIARKDCLKKDKMLLGYKSLAKSIPFHRGLYSNVKRIITLNTIYIGNLIALRRWYLDVRSRFSRPGSLDTLLIAGAVDKIERSIRERTKRLGQVAKKLSTSVYIDGKKKPGATVSGAAQNNQEFSDKWSEMEGAFADCLNEQGDEFLRDSFLNSLEKGTKEKGGEYLDSIRGLSQSEKTEGTNWLKGIVKGISNQIWEFVPGFNIDGHQYL